jgi:hypothetical protein
MHDLQTLQSLMTRAILARDSAEIAKELTAGNADAGRRFAIYRNNTLLSLTRHLKTVFPVTMRLGDERFFDYAANAFITRHPPREARLAVYGGKLARFLATLPACRHAPILAAMARLEWAVHEALVSDEHKPLPASAFRGEASAAQSVVLQPSLRFVLSRWPLLDLWSGRARPDTPLPRKATRLAIMRHGDDIGFFELKPARFAFWRALQRGKTFDAAAARALARDPHIDLVNETLALFRQGLVTAISPAAPSH